MGGIAEALESLHTYFQENFLDFIGFLLTVIGGGFALLQWRASIKTNRANYVEDILNKVMDDAQIQKFQRLADYGTDWYTEDFHRGKSPEIAQIADRTLFTYNYICYLYDTKIINKDELEIFTYYMLALAHDDELTCYFLDLYQYSLFSGRKFPFGHYLSFCEREGCVSRTVRDPRYYYYVLCMESQANGHDFNIAVPEPVRRMRETVGDRLYIETVSRCAHCRCSGGGDCSGGSHRAAHEWLGVTPPCSKFDFVPERWSDPGSAAK